MINESFDEEDSTFLDSQDDLILSEEELAALPAEELRRYSMRASIRSSIGANIDESNLSGQRGSIRKSIRGSIIQKNGLNQGFGVNTIDEAPEDYVDHYENNENAAIGRKESIAKSRKQSLDNYASLRASRDQFLSEEYIRGVPEDSEPEELPLNAPRRKSL